MYIASWVIDFNIMDGYKNDYFEDESNDFVVTNTSVSYNNYTCLIYKFQVKGDFDFYYKEYADVLSKILILTKLIDSQEKDDLLYKIQKLHFSVKNIEKTPKKKIHELSDENMLKFMELPVIKIKDSDYIKYLPKDVYGRLIWSFLHNLSILIQLTSNKTYSIYQSECFNENSKICDLDLLYLDVLGRIHYILFCGECIHHYKEKKVVPRFIIPHYYKGDIIGCCYCIHNAVNFHLGYNIFSVESFESKYKVQIEYKLKVNIKNTTFASK